MATGGREYQPAEYEYGQNKRVITQSELEQELFNNEQVHPPFFGNLHNPSEIATVASGDLAMTGLQGVCHCEDSDVHRRTKQSLLRNGGCTYNELFASRLEGRGSSLAAVGNNNPRLLNAVPSGSVVMIQCVGSRIPACPDSIGKCSYCSRVCCKQAIKNAIALKRFDSSKQVYILYRDIRTYGFKEDIYRAAREAGVIFIRYEPEQPPQLLTVAPPFPGERVGVEAQRNLSVSGGNQPGERAGVDGQMKIKTFHHILQKEIIIPADLLVLSTGIVPAASNSEISKILKVPLDQDGFFLEAHVKLRPVDFANEGIFLCGLAHSPKFIDENIIQSKAAAGRAAILLSKGEITVEKITACVTKELCASCLTCIRMCPYEAIRLDENNKAEVQMIKCQGCGICAAECPAKAIQLPHFTDAQITAMEEALAGESKE